ncbi:uncharacterized protein BCR38DRAFT_495207 [Pseudomassariella vexata]|uniref:F-box domain-containing protein n=1 Tax=Pseudomassariella vexata TaxID=1141098 RepID=A0A1Y2DQN6_9PEZI|nr:uncharacterized protein BCR38DRAFT_495207 [Pseudomassariella vexata]ORY61580.1 hypothetical protein BCR38DRAFT_495207 [Pseudomassariella vexata]
MASECLFGLLSVEIQCKILKEVSSLKDLVRLVQASPEIWYTMQDKGNELSGGISVWYNRMPIHAGTSPRQQSSQSVGSLWCDYMYKAACACPGAGCLWHLPEWSHESHHRCSGKIPTISLDSLFPHDYAPLSKTFLLYEFLSKAFHYRPGNPVFSDQEQLRFARDYVTHLGLYREKRRRNAVQKIYWGKYGIKCVFDYIYQSYETMFLHIEYDVLDQSERHSEDGEEGYNGRMGREAEQYRDLPYLDKTRRRFLSIPWLQWVSGPSPCS